MSKYEERLATKEALRDPYDPAPPEDEDEPSGILRRKLSVSFGSRFKERGKESIQDSISEVFADTPVIHIDDDDSVEGAAFISTLDSLTSLPPTSAGKVVIPKLTGGTRRKGRIISEAKAVINLGSIAGDVEPGKKRGLDNADERDKSPKPSRTSTESSASSTNASSEEPAPPEGWIKAFSNKQNKHYWYNVNTKKSVWEFPKE